MHLQHAGTYVFAGKLAALASIGASATADAQLLNKYKTDGGNASVLYAPIPINPINNSDLLKKFKPI
jgi:hypothetical protein